MINPPNPGLTGSWRIARRCLGTTITIAISMQGFVSAQDRDAVVPEKVRTRLVASVTQFLRSVDEIDSGIAGDQAGPASITGSSAGGTAVKPISIVRHRLWADPARGPAWLMRMNFGDVAVDARTMAILSFHDGNNSVRLQHEPPTDISKCLSLDAAIERSSKFLRATGMPTGDFRLTSAELRDDSVPPVAFTRRWTLDWSRNWRGVPFEDQAIRVVIAAGDGTLEAIGGAINMPPPSNDRLDVSQDTAIQIARRFLTGRKVGPLEDPVAFLRVALQDDWWTTDQPENTRTHAPSRLGWLVRFPVPLRAMTYMYEVRVDASTGRVIGGNMWGRERGIGSSAQAKNDAVEAISLSRQIEIRPIERPDAAPSIIRATGNPLAYYGAISWIAPPRYTKNPVPFVATHHLAVTRSDGARDELDYDSQSGIISAKSGQYAQADLMLRRFLAGSAH